MLQAYLAMVITKPEEEEKPSVNTHSIAQQNSK
jgi:hypothetical protein